MRRRPPPPEADTQAEIDAWFRDTDAWIDDHTPDPYEYQEDR